MADDEEEGLTSMVDGGSLCVDTAEDSEWSATPEYIVIREVFGSEDPDTYSEEQLEDALEDEITYIVIEPSRVGNETSKWILLGNFLHKTTVLAGLGCLSSGLLLPTKYRNYICIPLGVMSLSSVLIYGMSWQYDPCCKYQVEHNPRTLEKLHIDNLNLSSVVVLTRRDDKYRKRLHNCIALAVASYFGWNLYKWYCES
eukprot:gene8841-9789_t